MINHVINHFKTIKKHDYIMWNIMKPPASCGCFTQPPRPLPGFWPCSTAAVGRTCFDKPLAARPRSSFQRNPPQSPNFPQCLMGVKKDENCSCMVKTRCFSIVASWSPFLRRTCHSFFAGFDDISLPPIWRSNGSQPSGCYSKSSTSASPNGRTSCKRSSAERWSWYYLQTGWGLAGC